jgi:YVTN family beta-propeller protein
MGAGVYGLFAIVLAMGLALAACPAEAAPFLYVTNEFDNTVSVIDTATNTVVGSPIPVGSVPTGLPSPRMGQRSTSRISAAQFR